MKLLKNFKISQRTLLTHKVRTILALLGIIVGVSAVIIMIAIGNGSRQEVVSKIEAMGTNLLIVNAGDVKPTAGRRKMRGKVTTLKMGDVREIEDKIPQVEEVVPVQSKKMQVKYGSYSTGTNIVGTSPNFPFVRNFTAEEGWFFGEKDNRLSQRKAVLGYKVAENLFERTDPVGEIIRIGKVPFEVIGVMEPKGVDMYGTDQDDQIFIPIITALRRVFNQDHIEAIYIQIEQQNEMASALQGIKGLLRERHHLNRSDKKDDFTIESQVELIEAQEETSNTFTTMTAGIAGVSLVVGGIGILAIMLLSIRERRQEIGLRMAVGASRNDIRIQFLFESSYLSIGGGLIGILIGVVASFLLNWLLEWTMIVSLFSVGLSFGFALFIGLFFGIYPAHKASLLEPMEALRSE